MLALCIYGITSFRKALSLLEPFCARWRWQPSAGAREKWPTERKQEMLNDHIKTVLTMNDPVFDWIQTYGLNLGPINRLHCLPCKITFMITFSHGKILLIIRPMAPCYNGTNYETLNYWDVNQCIAFVLSFFVVVCLLYYLITPCRRWKMLTK